MQGIDLPPIGMAIRQVAQYTNQALHQRESRMGGLRLLPDLDGLLGLLATNVGSGQRGIHRQAAGSGLFSLLRQHQCNRNLRHDARHGQMAVRRQGRDTNEKCRRNSGTYDNSPRLLCSVTVVALQAEEIAALTATPLLQ